MVGVVFLGGRIEGDLMTHGMKALAEDQAPVMGLVLLFSFGFPLGLVAALVGALLISGANTRSAIAYFMIGFGLLILTAIAPPLFGSETGGSYFGTGGLLIMVGMVVSFWFWGQYRVKLKASETRAADLSALGYLCFGLAAWNTCGLAAMPSFALFPELMIKLDMRSFAVGQSKAIMAFFVIGWLFTAAAMVLKARSR